MLRTASFAGAVSLLSLASTAHAAVLLSSPLWTDVDNAGICIVRNVSTTSVPVQVRLFSNNGFQVHIDNCNTPGFPLGPGKTCSVFSFDLPDDSFVECSVKASDVNVSKLRGSIETRHFATPTSNGKVVVSDNLR
jgi:hypothetical protein